MVVLAGALVLVGVPRPPDITAVPDGLADALIAGHSVAARLRPVGRPLDAVVTLAQRRAAPLVRRYPVSAAAILSVVFGIGLGVAAAREEGDRKSVV